MYKTIRNGWNRNIQRAFLMSTSTPYAPQIKIPELLERGKSNTSTLPIYRDGSLVVPDAVRYTLIKPQKTKNKSKYNKNIALFRNLNKNSCNAIKFNPIL